MATVKTPKRQDNVNFHFVNADDDSYLLGSVIVRDGEMVLDIPGGYGPYLIVGRLTGHYYAGTNNVRGGTTQVEARWADVGGMHVGVWREGTEEFLFSFEL